MSKNFFDVSAGIGTCENKTYFANHSVQHISANLLELISIDGQRYNVAMFDALLTIFSLLRAVKRTMRKNAIRDILQIGVSNNVGHIVMLVIPYKRNSLAITVFESVLSNYSSVRALQIITRGITHEIVLYCHFDVLLYSVLVRLVCLN